MVQYLDNSFAKEKTIGAAENTLENLSLIKNKKVKPGTIVWFKINEIAVNPDNFWAIPL